MSQYEAEFELCENFRIPLELDYDQYTGLLNIELCDRAKSRLRSTWVSASDYQSSSIKFRKDIDLGIPITCYHTEQIKKPDGKFTHALSWISSGKTLATIGGATLLALEAMQAQLYEKFTNVPYEFVLTEENNEKIPVSEGEYKEIGFRLTHKGTRSDWPIVLQAVAVGGDCSGDLSRDRDFTIDQGESIVISEPGAEITGSVRVDSKMNDLPEEIPIQPCVDNPSQLGFWPAPVFADLFSAEPAAPTVSLDVWKHDVKANIAFAGETPCDGRTQCKYLVTQKIVDAAEERIFRFELNQPEGFEIEIDPFRKTREIELTGDPEEKLVATWTIRGIGRLEIYRFLVIVSSKDETPISQKRWSEIRKQMKFRRNIAYRIQP